MHKFTDSFYIHHNRRYLYICVGVISEPQLWFFYEVLNEELTCALLIIRMNF